MAKERAFITEDDKKALNQKITIKFDFMLDQELEAVVMPDGSVQLEWNSKTGRTNKSSSLLQREIYDRFLSDPDSWLLLLGFCNKQVDLSSSLDFWRSFAGLFTRKLSQTPDIEELRHEMFVPLEDEDLAILMDLAPMMTGSEYLDPDVFEETWSGLNKAFCNEIKSYDGTVEEFVKSCSPDVHLVGRVFFHLVENKNSNDPFAFLATYSTRLSKDGKSKHLPLKYALQEYSEDSGKMLELLATVHTAANQSHLIDDLLATGELFHPLSWSAREAFVFLKEIPIYEQAGILCRIPNWWKGKTSSSRINISLGGSAPSVVGMDALLDFEPRLYLGEHEITIEEARKLLNETEGLAFIKNRWVAVDPDKLKQTLEAYENVAELISENGLSLGEALRLQLNPQKLLAGANDKVEATISNGKWLESVFEKLRRPETTSIIKTDGTFKARLREYQQKGLNWLHFLHQLRFGACLADDMGLGKTVQLLAFLNTLKTDPPGSRKPGRASLLVIPASLIANWSSEIQRFSPGLKFFLAHPDFHKSKKLPVMDTQVLDSLDLVITTYALIQKFEWVRSYTWRYIILDEAQAIKNPGTKQTRAVKKLGAENRIVMTGTPIENRLSDLWSLFDFLNPGLLGNNKEFSRFAKGLKGDPSGYSRLRKLISPFILRRLKTDKSVISDLPDKVEMKTWAPLSKKQVLLYNDTIKDIKESIESSEGIQKKGIVLAALMKFKQLCNHPDQFLGTGRFEEKESGKFGRLREICETIYEKREKVLVFTQFKEMTEPLGDFLATIFERKGLILHGSIPVGKRKNIIDKFQSREYVPFMILSLKAGGIGLNLTEANHVIHFDRWWNPAVENQATDRVFRIGQKKNVVVHKFVTKGTVEERIDTMLQEKTKLSDDVIASTGENWITEMNNEELVDLFTLKL